MPYLLKLVIPCLLLGASVTAQEVTTRSINGVACQADRRYDQLQSNTQSKIDSYKAQLDAMMTCQTDKKLWDGTQCVDVTPPPPPACQIINNILNTTTTEINQAIVQWSTYTSPEIETSRCHWFWDRGRSRNISEIRSIRSCQPQGVKVQVSGQYVTIFNDTCIPNPRTEVIWGGQSRHCTECFSLPLC